jgi:uncharacterized membrane protein YcaP (DUF421 family)
MARAFTSDGSFSMSDWSNLSNLAVSPLNLAVRGFVVYLWVLILVRISGKRQIGQMGPTEFVAILLISNAVQNSMNGGDNSLLGGMLLASVLIFLSWTISVLTYRFKTAQNIFEGSPTLLVHKGKVVKENLTREHLRMSELITLLRKQGMHDVKEVASAVLEADGTLVVTRADEKPFPLQGR